MHHRRLDFEEAVSGHVVADGLDDAAACDEGEARLLVGDEVEMAAAVLLLGVGKARNFSGSGRSAFDSSRSSEHFTVSSPVLVLNRVPTAPTISRCPSA